MDLPTVATFISSVSFLFFGTGCLISPRMKSEFIRYGYDQQRVLTGYLQLLGSLGLAIGYWTTTLISFSAALGLCLMMIFGFGVRLKIRDGFVASSPAFIYAVINLYLSFHYGCLL